MEWWFNSIFEAIDDDINDSLKAIESQYNRAFKDITNEYKSLIGEINEQYEGFVKHAKARIKDVAELAKKLDEFERKRDVRRKEALKDKDSKIIKLDGVKKKAKEKAVERNKKKVGGW